MRPGDFVIVNDIIGCVQSMSPLRILCQDGVIREVHAQPAIIMTGQSCALMYALRAMRRIQEKP